MKKTISILGAGWLGLPLAERLLELGYRVKASTTSPEKILLLQQKGLEAYLLRVDQGRIEGDVGDFFSCEILFLNIPPSRRRPDVETWYPEQISAVVTAAMTNKVPKLIFASSSGVYGDVMEAVFEATDPQPDTASARALVAAETTVRNIYVWRGMGNILRFSGLVGGNRKAGRFFAGKTEVPEGAAPVNLVHLDDCIGVIEAILQQDRWGEFYNVCADEHPRKDQFYVKQAIQQGFTPPSFLLDEPSPRYKIVRNDKIKRDLGYVFRWPDPLDFP
jgi:nucleoside-diphosphate-sugar epimerase